CWAITYAPTGETMALCLAGVGVVVLEWPSCKEVRAFKKMVHSVVYRPDGQCLAGRSDSSQIALLNLKATPKATALKAHHKWVKSVACYPDGRLIASGGSDSTVRLWDLATQQQRACFEWQLGAIWGVAFAPNGMTAAAVGEKGIVVFDVDVA